MLKNRVIPCLQLLGESLVKTVNFKKHVYIGDPVNTAKIFNELEADELVIVDISATSENREPNFKVLGQLASECFMPLSYGGGIANLEQAKKIFSIGFEKVILNTSTFEHSGLVSEMATLYGSQSVVVAIDVKKNFWGQYEVYSHSGTIKEKKNLVFWAQELEQRGAGEVLLTSIDREGTWKGFDLDLIKTVVDSIHIPVIAHGGSATITDIQNAIKVASASAVALGSMVVFQGKGLGVLVNFPDRKKLEAALI